MEQIVILILFFLLPGLIKRISKQQQKSKGGAPKRVRPARRVRQRRPRDPGPLARMPGAAPPTPDPEPEPEPAAAAEEMPEWLRELATRLGREDVLPRPEPVASDATVEESVVVERDVTPGRDWDRIAETAPVYPSPEPRPIAESMPVKAPPRRALHGAMRAGAYRAVGRTDWRRAFVLAEVLGAPRALAPYSDPSTKG